ncbi:MAG: SMP-30/gluconolactonase/LRE family protein [Candidatus Thorarchaeota archaeon]
MKKITKTLLFVTVITLIVVSISVYSMPISTPSKDEDKKINPLDWVYRRKTLVESTPLRGCNGLVFGKDGALYVCQTSPNSISKVKLSGRCGPSVEEFVGPQHGVITPDDITVDDEGNFYATSAIGGEVYKINPQGMKQVIARGLNGPNGICFDEETGRLFMSECFWGNNVYELDPEGVEDPRLVTAGLVVPEGFDIRDGELVIPDFGTWTIVVVDMDTGIITPLVTEGLITPIALTIGPDGYIYTPELATGLVKKISPDGSEIEILTQLLPGLDNLAFGPDGYLYVSSYHDATIWKVNPFTGENVMLFPMGINSVASIVTQGEDLYLCDSIMIRRIDEEGNVYKTWANAWLSPYGYPLPTTMTNGLGGQLITADFIDGVVANVNILNDVEDWTLLVEHENPLSSPAGMELDTENQMLYIAEYGAGQIIEINLETLERRIVADYLSGPVDLVMKDQTLYVAEALAGRITMIDIVSGVKEIFLNGYVGKPKGLAWDHNGNLLIFDTAARELINVNMENLDIRTIASNLPMVHTTYYSYPLIWDTPAPIAVNEHGDIFLAGSDGSVIMLKYKGHHWWGW